MPDASADAIWTTLSRWPLGYFTATYTGHRYGVTRSVHAGGKSILFTTNRTSPSDSSGQTGSADKSSTHRHKSAFEAADRLCGRYAGLWGVMDVVRLGGALYAFDPTDLDPAADPERLEMIGPQTLRFGHDHGYGSTGETLEFTLGDDGSVRSARGSSGNTSFPFDAFADTVARRDRVRLGEPVRPDA